MDDGQSFVKTACTDRIKKFSNEFLFEEAVFKRFNALHGQGPAAAPAGLSVQDTQTLNNEKQGINNQLAIWQNLPPNAAGCNADSTWGTSFGGAVPGFNPHHVNAAVWAKLRQWWGRKTGAYITPSLTTTWSLKMWRDVGNANLSPTFNYNVNVP